LKTRPFNERCITRPAGVELGHGPTYSQKAVACHALWSEADLRLLKDHCIGEGRMLPLETKRNWYYCIHPSEARRNFLRILHLHFLVALLYFCSYSSFFLPFPHLVHALFLLLNSLFLFSSSSLSLFSFFSLSLSPPCPFYCSPFISLLFLLDPLFCSVLPF